MSVSTSPAVRLAHELGHSAAGLDHAGPPPGYTVGSGGRVWGGDDSQGTNECTNGGDCDDDWPWPYGTTGAFGFDVFTMEVKPPGTSHQDYHDVMSYGRPRWISPRNWTRLFNAFTDSDWPYAHAYAADAAAAASSDDSQVGTQSYFLVAGKVEETGAWSLSPVYEVDASYADLAEPQSGAYRIDFMDEGGTLVGSHSFDLSQQIDSQFDRRTFAQVIAAPSSVQRLVLRDDLQVFIDIERSSNSPQLQILSPVEGLAVVPGGSIPITWAGNDEDGDTLYYTVQYSGVIRLGDEFGAPGRELIAINSPCRRRSRRQRRCKCESWLGWI